MIKVFTDIEELSNFAAEKFVAVGNDAIEKRRQFFVALSGGSTPKSLYRLLSDEKFKNKIDWHKVFFFFGDERSVSLDDKESNFRMANENIFQPLQISDSNVFPWRVELKDEEAIARDYQKTIESCFRASPRFDLILLGMGADGHTASLFPETSALSESEKLTAANWVEKLNDFRLTMTFPLINNARSIIFLVSGAEKAKTVKEVLRGRYQPEKFPAQSVKPENGSLIWLLDEKAAQFLG